ncbi:hypothetical protein AK812_SmicGene48927, partial [Symbiodinium microadriaticum]
ERANACPRASGRHDWSYEGTTLHALLAPTLTWLDSALAKRGGI